MNWYFEVLKKYAVFSGRARRKEYWYFVLFNIIVIIVLTFIDVMTGTYNEQANIGLLSGIYILVVLIPGIAVAVRRLHDTDRSDWWLLIGLIPLIRGHCPSCFHAARQQAGRESIRRKSQGGYSLTANKVLQQRLSSAAGL